MPLGEAGEVTLRDVSDVITTKAHHQVDEAPKLVTIDIPTQPGNCIMFLEEHLFWTPYTADAILAGARGEQTPMPDAKT